MARIISIGMELGDRLRRIYKLEAVPSTTDEFLGLLKARFEKDVGMQNFIQRVKSRQEVIGECNHPTRNRLILEGRKVYVACAYDALVTAILWGNAIISASCPHCSQQMKIIVQARRLTSYSRREIVFWWGTGPDDSVGHPVCDHLHFFPSEDHLAEWLPTVNGELGFSLTLEEAADFFTERFES